MKGGRDTRDWNRGWKHRDGDRGAGAANTFPLFLDGLGLRHGETLHGLVLLPRHVLLLGRRPSLAVGVRVDQHAAGEGVAVSAGRVAAAMID